MQKTKLLSCFLVLAVTILLCGTALYGNGVTNLYGYSRAALSYYGSSGQEVKNIQSKLKNWGYYNGAVDGIYGYQTYTAVRDFQYKNKLEVDGVAGPETLSALGLPTGEAESSAANWKSSDVKLLAHLIHGEARGEPYTGKVAVAAVVMNRIRDSRFPKTISGVIYQPGAFDAVADGQINLEPDDSSRKAARDALNGWDPSYGCIYYYNPSTATSNWIWTRQIIVKIGKHNFAK
ncbi:N-acetylmuramoyl-L-alanine amidase [Anaerobacterium chartisolvens]|uniref:Spore cortex-lytic enzyme n=1 Tax=Anaerobacterium chartisolvens TaxID=1297424 RepID=A0A369BB87_9FIRM|nr:spore cortex-lytic enzyme [Anaerobacterium chartisolvens]RCX18790.1 N-acetylmuramoyl-L-alanine amidase [Anaerobacterium chartisolvens]